MRRLAVFCAAAALILLTGCAGVSEDAGGILRMMGQSGGFSAVVRSEAGGVAYSARVKFRRGRVLSVEILEPEELGGLLLEISCGEGSISFRGAGVGTDGMRLPAAEAAWDIAGFLVGENGENSHLFTDGGKVFYSATVGVIGRVEAVFESGSGRLLSLRLAKTGLELLIGEFEYVAGDADLSG